MVRFAKEIGVVGGDRVDQVKALARTVGFSKETAIFRKNRTGQEYAAVGRGVPGRNARFFSPMTMPARVHHELDNLAKIAVLKRVFRLHVRLRRRRN